MDSREPINLLIEIRKIILFFCFSFIFFFLVLSLNQAFNYFRNQLNIFETQAQILKEGLPSTSDVLSSRSGIEASLKPEKIKFVLTEKPDSLEIPRLSLGVPLVFSKMAEVKEVVKDLLRGVAVYPGSDSPGGEGRMFILGHSSPPGWPKLKYYWVFSQLNDLETGDEIFINFENKQYRYQITQKIFLAKGEEIPVNENNSQQLIYLITCWPPGQDVRRLAVEAVLTSPAALTNQ
ncbi:MAG: sortase [bacterium]|nr:sortase [bacterium]